LLLKFFQATGFIAIRRLGRIFLKAILDNEYTTVADWEAEVKKLEEEIAAAKVKEQQYNIEKGKLEVANPKLISDL